MDSITVHPRVKERHPEINDEDVITAWNSFICRTTRVDTFDDNHIAVGFDATGRLLEMVAVQLPDNGWFVFHAMLATTKALRELGLI